MIKEDLIRNLIERSLKITRKNITFALVILLMTGSISAQVSSSRLICDCAYMSRGCIPFTIQFHGQDAELKLLKYEFTLKFRDVWIDPMGVKNSIYTKNGHIEAVTTYPLGDNWVALHTHPEGKEISHTFCHPPK
jgi:hypothetical protein